VQHREFYYIPSELCTGKVHTFRHGLWSSRWKKTALYIVSMAVLLIGCKNMFCKYVEIQLFSEISFQENICLVKIPFKQYCFFIDFYLCFKFWNVSDQWVSAQIKFNLMILQVENFQFICMNQESRWRVSNIFEQFKLNLMILIRNLHNWWNSEQMYNKFLVFFFSNFVMQRKTWPSRRQFSQIWLQNRHETKYILIYILGHLL